ncbi:hypothetical protein SASPL_118773 [Salvia splendens]|uniref:Polygalacturonase n=1 Tax=Salvia splendens TaxID=180675 RepID=A0A8X8Y2B7_SALSN|nr:hypothetical protein SASPL_118773 [Salvia splendens]
MQGFVVYLLLLMGSIFELSVVKCARSKGSDSGTSTTFDVTKFGAIGNGKTDDAKAFTSAWEAACNKGLGTSKITVPSGKTFLVSAIKFAGPCKSRSITFEILGTIVAVPKQAWGKGGGDGDAWILFHQVQGLSVVGNGKGVFDGQGASWWPRERKNDSPTALRFSHCDNLSVSGLKHMNSQKNHISINGCNHANISNLHITAPGTSPNTDGIDISSSTNLSIQDCVMATGDDCIAINGGTSGVKISRITCGPGHGISIGSLGKNGKHEEVERILVENCTFIKTQNGVRIKSWQDGAVKVSGVKYIGVRGTTVAKDATIDLKCSKTVPCTDIEFSNINIKSVGGHADSAKAKCTNAQGTARSCTPPIHCVKT